MFYRTQFTLCLILFLTLLSDAIAEQVGGLNYRYPSFVEPGASDFVTTYDSTLVEDSLQAIPVEHSANMLNLSGGGRHKGKFMKQRRRKSRASFNDTPFLINIQAWPEDRGGKKASVQTEESRVPDHNNKGQWLAIIYVHTNENFQVHMNSTNLITHFEQSSYGVEISRKDMIYYEQNDRLSYVMVPLGRHRTRLNVTKLKKLKIGAPTRPSKHHLHEHVYMEYSSSIGTNVKNFTSEDDQETRTSNHMLWLWITIPLVIILSSGWFITCYFCRRKRLIEKQKNLDPYIKDKIKSTTTSPYNFQLKKLKSATSNFDSINKLGKGGFGIVYKGFLKEINMEVAIKRVSKGSSQGQQEFIAEVTTISHLEHKNIVKLIGWCYEDDELLLVYKFMPNGSLDKFIYSDESQKTPEVILSWERRLHIICGVASALDYLHDGCEKKVLHRDVKASNVMLDAEFNGRLGDFGLARTIHIDGETHHSTEEIAGTPGYMAPECLLTGRATIETDVYGFGVFIMEVASGVRPGKHYHTNQSRKNNIVDWLWDLYGRARILEAVDPRLQEKFNKEQMEQTLKLGLACCHPNPIERPSMRVALQVLRGETPSPILPHDKPAFVWPIAISSYDDPQICFEGGQLSINTVLSGR